MTPEAAIDLATEFKTLVARRTGLTPDQLVCPREKSAMTPCLARDGHLVVVMDMYGHPLCVGCKFRLQPLLDAERAKQRA